MNPFRLRVDETLPHVGGVKQGLGRDTPDQEAGTPELGLLFDELRVLHDHQREIGEPELLRSAHFTRLGASLRDAKCEQRSEERSHPSSEHESARHRCQSAPCRR